MGGRLGALLALLLLAPAAAATAQFALDADVRWYEPTSVQGILTPGPGTGNVIRAVPTDLSGEETPVLLAGETQTHFRLHHWVETKPGLGGMAKPVTTDIFVTNPRLTWVASINDPDVLMQPSKLAAPARLDAAACTLTVPTADETTHYPEIASSPSSVAPWEFSPTRRQLQADCTGTTVDATGPEQVLFYGMVLRLTGDGYAERIVTGTCSSLRFEDCDRGGGRSTETTLLGASAEGEMVFQERTQVLEALLDGAAVATSLPAGRVTVYASEFLATGSIDMAHSNGRLAWGAREERGDVHPVQAQGIFAFSRGRDDTVVVEGRTTDAPAAIVAPPVAGARNTPLITAAAAGLVALAAAFAWILYTRADHGSAAEHPRRRLLLDLVQADPGVGTNALARSMNLRWPGVAYHLERLQRGGLVVVRRVGGRTAVFPAAGFRGKELGVVLLRQETPRRALDVLRSQPGMDQPTLAQILALSQSQVSRVLKSLRAAGLVDQDRDLGRLTYRATTPSAPTPEPAQSPA